MWRYMIGGVAALLLTAAGIMLFTGSARPGSVLPLTPGVAQAQAAQDEPLPDRVPEASAKTREQKRFDRYDKDRDGKIMRDEYLAARRKAYAKLDTNHDGTLSFDEWAITAETKFATADSDKSGAMNAAEFATTAVKRSPKRQPNCPKTPTPAAHADDGEDS